MAFIMSLFTSTHNEQIASPLILKNFNKNIFDKVAKITKQEPMDDEVNLWNFFEAIFPKLLF